jgi:hypothetical protein
VPRALSKFADWSAFASTVICQFPYLTRCLIVAGDQFCGTLHGLVRSPKLIERRVGQLEGCGLGHDGTPEMLFLRRPSQPEAWTGIIQRLMHVPLIDRAKAPASILASPLQLALNLLDFSSIRGSDCGFGAKNQKYHLNERICRDCGQLWVHGLHREASKLRSTPGIGNPAAIGPAQTHQ